MTVEEALAHWRTVPDAWAWIESRPKSVRDIIERMPPGTWWVYKDGALGLYTPYSYSEDGTVTLTKFDPMFAAMPELRVFGCNPCDFEPTDYTPETAVAAFYNGTLRSMKDSGA